MEKNKTVVITGANSGIGRATAFGLAEKGWDVVSLCRNKAEGEKLAAELKQNYPNTSPQNYVLDLADLEGIRETANALRQNYPVISRLINNAGYFPSEISYVEGVEASFYASHLGHMLLTLALLPSLEASPEGRIVILSSALHSNGKFARFFREGNDLDGMKAYADAKLANMLFAIGLTKHLPSHLTAYSLHPGVVKTNIAKNLTGFFKFMMDVSQIFMLSPEKGAATSIYLATAPIDELKAYNGQYFEKSRISKMKNADANLKNAEILWEKSIAFLKPYLGLS